MVLDFGGVLAEEGFREGLLAIGRGAGLDPQGFFEKATELIFECGFVTGQATEHHYWNLIRQAFAIERTDQELRNEILARFVLRPWMLGIVRDLRTRGYPVAILSDQTDWLDELDTRHDFFKEFVHVFNSFHLAMSKKDGAIFAEVARSLGLRPSEMLFVDDNPGNVERARRAGFRGMVYRDQPTFVAELRAAGLL